MALDNPTVARRYSQALFEVAQEKGQLKDLSLELNELKKGLLAQPQFMTFMASPAIKPEAKLAMINAMTEEASDLTKNLVMMAYDYGRIANLVAIIDAFNNLYDEYEKVVRVKVTTAIELDKEQEDKLSDSFAKLVGAKKVIVNPQIDESIIGGVVLQSKSYIYDGSIKTKIERIKRLLLK